MSTQTSSHFDEMFRDDPDPWSFRSSWYERRKRGLILASLPRSRFVSGYEPACANGETSAELAGRVDSLLCSDFSTEALALARRRLAGLENVRLTRHCLPAEWPQGRFELIVLGELGYYLAPDDWACICERAAASLQPGGVLVACHWRHPIDGCSLTGDAVHEYLARAMSAAATVSHVERDFRLELWFDEAAA
ncbi:methyltransferase domain-containing protein [Pseudomonas sp. BGr12]|uniref:methyltransferase domain-containing protein n=1 Tax=unclassified Pseudomonas TaxID=196821 RepID=UPI001E56DA5C|nr:MULTISPECIES: methyltransferase domain-containing protein [unclassified Pseudomonas]MDL2428210.1 methyltransferase domain-containing protein [Pseudomonas sp. BJa5]